MRTRSWTPLLLVVFIGLMACGEGADQEAETKEGRAETEQATQQQGAMTEVSVMLSPKNQSGVEGEARIRRTDSSYEVQLLLQGIEPDTSYPAHLHEGSCDAGGGVAAALNEVSSGKQIGTSSSSISGSDVSPDASYFIQAHRPDGTPVACGNVPAGAFGSSGGM